MIQKVKELSDNISMTGTKGERRKLTGYLEALPQRSLSDGWEMEESESLGEAALEDALIPYCIVRTTEINYEENEGKAKVYLVFCLYDQDSEMRGYQTMWNLLNRITGYFRTYQVLDAFYCERAMKAVVQEEDTYPYFFGGIEMTWNLPNLECEEVEDE